MKLRPIVLPLLALAFVSCDKAKDMANKASSAVKDKISTSGDSKNSGKADPELEKLVDRTEEGVMFRKDLPFPNRIDLRTSRRSVLSCRFTQTSAIEKRTEVLSGSRIHIAKLERSASQVRYTHEQSSFAIPTPDDPKAGDKVIANPLEQVAPSVKPITFHKTGNSWKTHDSDGFRAASLSKELAPVFDQLLVDHALVPRPLWFAKRRYRVGDELTVTGELLPMLIAGKAKGTLNLKLEAFESVAGHPCGVFSITGDYSRKGFPSFDGTFTDEEVTIESGKIWMSLIHPIVLKEEFDTIQSFKSGGQGNLTGRGQGTVKVFVEHEWKGL